MKYPYLIIDKNNIKVFIELLKPLGYCINAIINNLGSYPYVVLDALEIPGTLAFYDNIIPSRYHEHSIYKFVYIAANIKKVAPSINTRLYLLKL